MLARRRTRCRIRATASDTLVKAPRAPNGRGGIAIKFMCLQHYGRVEGDVPPMSQWAPEDVVAHIQFQKDLNADLRERGEFVEAQALAGPEAAKAVLASDSAPIVTAGPFAESKELLAGWRTVDVESEERALEIAAEASEGPGPNGVPLRQQIEVRQVMDPIEPTE